MPKRERNIRVTAVMREEPDLALLARALIEIARDMEAKKAVLGDPDEEPAG